MRKFFAVALFFCTTFSLLKAELPAKVRAQMLKYSTSSDIELIIKMCNEKAIELNTPAISFIWNIAMESDFNPHILIINEQKKYFRVGGLSFNKTSCAMVGLFELHDSWETMKERAMLFSKLSLLEQLPYIFAYYEWQKYYRYKDMSVALTEIDMRFLTYYPIACRSKKSDCISKKTEREVYERNPKYDLDKNNIITRLEISVIYEGKKNQYSLKNKKYNNGKNQ